MRYFITGVSMMHDLEQKIKRHESDKVFQVILQKPQDISRFIWFLLSEDIRFDRKSVGGGVSVFFVDRNYSYFLK